jgi:hypothetical protein
LAIGFFIGGGITLGFLDALGLTAGLFEWILALIGGVVAALVFVRYMPWAFIIFASLVGSMLIVRGATIALLPSLVGPLGTLLVVILTGLGIFYHYRRRGGKVVEAGHVEDFANGFGDELGLLNAYGLSAVCVRDVLGVEEARQTILSRQPPWPCRATITLCWLSVFVHIQEQRSPNSLTGSQSVCENSRTRIEQVASTGLLQKLCNRSLDTADARRRSTSDPNTLCERCNVWVLAAPACD